MFLIDVFVPSSSPSKGKGRAVEPPALIIDTIDVLNLVDELAGSDSGESSHGNIVIVHGTKWAQLDAEAEVERQAVSWLNNLRKTAAMSVILPSMIMIRCWNQHDTDPAAYQLNLKDIRAEGRGLLSLLLERTQIVVDEAGRLTEAMTTLTFSHFPQTPTIFIGDTKQSGPLAIAEEDREYRVLFLKQRKRSLLQRMEAAGQVDFVLRVNYRAHGDVVQWPMEEMHIWVHEECEASYRQDAQPQAAMIFVDVKDGVCEKVGTSYINTTNARSCKDKAESTPIPPLHLGKVLIIVGYRQQKKLVLSQVQPLWTRIAREKWQESLNEALAEQLTEHSVQVLPSKMKTTLQTWAAQSGKEDIQNWIEQAVDDKTTV
ncbi:hypothetical protein LI328DRAFT_141401 [Trichoderma asperelloides]|nr:hypothetical protein LI328DRAFT_141401 [Trichoderma asperelloides]